ncbi:MAG: hypothetical protein IJP79_04920 [Paludibacteraceae bacterium]|nr:hypothetical protein [Paludibacteraceae bacterium]
MNGAFDLVWWFGASTWFGYAHQPTLSNRCSATGREKSRSLSGAEMRDFL